MRLIKAFLVGAIGLFVIITLFSLLIPSRVRVSRGISINHTLVAAVLPQVAVLENWKKWHPIFTMDHTSLQAEAAPGNYVLSHGERQILVRSLRSDSNTVRFLLQARGENDIDNEIVITPLPEGAVQVEWRAITRLHWYPWEKFYGIFVDKLTGPGYETALNGLQEYMEKSTLPGS